VSAVQRILRDIAIVSGGQAVTWVATFVFVLAQARFLGPARFGELSLALSYAAFFAIVVDFGVATHITRAVAQARSGEGTMLWSALTVRAALWLVALPLAWLLTVLLGYEAELQATIVVLVDSLLFVGVAGALTAFSQGHERFLLPTLANALQRVTAAIVGIAVLAAGFGVVSVAVVYAISAALAVALLVIGLRGRGLTAPRLDRRPTWLLVSAALPIGLYWIIGTFYFNVDMALVEHMTPRESLGHYAAAYRLFNALAIVPAIVCGTVLYPVYSKLSTSSTAALRPAVEKTIAYLTLAGVLVTVLCAGLATPIIGVLYPMPAYGPAANALRLLAPGLLFLYVNSVLGSALFALHHERRLLAIAAAAAVLNTSANLVAIPVFGQEAAAAITSVTELFLLGALVVASPPGLVRTTSARLALRAIAAGCVTAIVIQPLATAPVVVAGAVGIAVFAATCLVLQAFPLDDLRSVTSLVRGRVRGLGPSRTS
jgi:O-antigen/teichoic acid export membrane protein